MATNRSASTRHLVGAPLPALSTAMPGWLPWRSAASLHPMKIAWHDRWSDPEVVEFRDVDVTIPTGDEALGTVRAASVNRGKIVITVQH